MTLAGAHLLALELPREDKRVLAIAETDGCFLSGIQTAGDLHACRRTLRVVDLGRIAATFIDTHSELAWRLAPRHHVRERAAAAVPDAKHRFHAMMEAYVSLPTAELLAVQRVRLEPTPETLVGRPHVRVDCHACGEEIINAREAFVDGEPVCPACRGHAYFRPVASSS